LTAPAELRARLFRAIHAAGIKRGLDHEALRDVCRERFGAESMKTLSINDLQQLYKGFEGRFLAVKKRKKKPLPKRGTAKTHDLEIVSPDHLETLARAFAMRGWGKSTQREFVRRQLGGREQIRTTRDFQRVFRGVQAMNRRDGIEGA